MVRKEGEGKVSRSVVMGRTDGRRYKAEMCPRCGKAMNIVSTNYGFDEFGIKRFSNREILLFNVCEECRVQTPITGARRLLDVCESQGKTS